MPRKPMLSVSPCSSQMNHIKSPPSRLIDSIQFSICTIHVQYMLAKSVGFYFMILDWSWYQTAGLRQKTSWLRKWMICTKKKYFEILYFQMGEGQAGVRISILCRDCNIYIVNLCPLSDQVTSCFSRRQSTFWRELTCGMWLISWCQVRWARRLVV